MKVLDIPETGGVPDLTQPLIGVGPFYDVREPRACLWRRGAGVYAVFAPTGDSLAPLEAQATAVYTLAEWLSDADRRARWGGRDADERTIAGFDNPADLVTVAGAANPNLVVSDDGRALIVDDADGVPLEADS